MDSNHTCLAVISLDSALNKNGNYYPQVFLNTLWNNVYIRNVNTLWKKQLDIQLMSQKVLLIVLMKNKLKL